MGVLYSGQEACVCNAFDDVAVVVEVVVVRFWCNLVSSCQNRKGGVSRHEHVREDTNKCI